MIIWGVKRCTGNYTEWEYYWQLENECKQQRWKLSESAKEWIQSKIGKIGQDQIARKREKLTVQGSWSWKLFIYEGE